VTLTRSDVSRLLTSHGLRPSRALGQNFVVDPNTLRRIVKLAGVEEGSRIVEIGAGLGSLTLALAEAGARVLAIERDRHLVPVLREVVAPWPVEILEADALKLDWSAVLGSERWSLVANLPYNVASSLVVQILEGAPQVERLLVMVQREVGERMAGTVGTKAYGALSVKIAYWATASVVGRVPASVFMPEPKVESVLVALVRRASPAVPTDVVPYDRFEAVVRAGFAHRRKMLRGALAGVVTAQDFERAGVAPEARAESLDVEAWGRLAAGGGAAQ
jgi:16S rRNA (adenine1518-N6/adenine1519-N6)-dimethyltransferase